ncbi:hypothetical protein FJ546_20765 [Mesorhizobium sp. B2-4-19]|uniref:hypothetical protein n=1 Tax=Mesorhizobium sp. B2-4-19 TaxID=2589930 RepID=UPI00112A923A|nr:hypothetical protein [Mesorhizobium sp. B2-4-19]TPK60127.1 hypothetical protein FJ546_20765 [Mesorhizobium sp. B2-4-19]
MPVDEFNRVPAAGVTNIARLSEMLESAAIAFVKLGAASPLASSLLSRKEIAGSLFPVALSQAKNLVVTMCQVDIAVGTSSERDPEIAGTSLLRDKLMLVYRRSPACQAGLSCRTKR